MIFNYMFQDLLFLYVYDINSNYNYNEKIHKGKENEMMKK